MTLIDILSIKKKISFNYYIKEVYEVGIVLFGWEVKSIKNNNFNILNNYIFFKNFECFISKMYISGKSFILDDKNLEYRDRKVLLKKKEINYLFGLSRLKGCTLLISSFYIKNNFIKSELCVCFGKRKYEKKNLKYKEFSKYDYL